MTKPAEAIAKIRSHNFRDVNVNELSAYVADALDALVPPPAGPEGAEAKPTEPVRIPNGMGRIEESVANWNAEARLDKGARVLRNVVVTAGKHYRTSALSCASKLYDHKPVFFDYAERKNRSTRDLIGALVNSRFENGAIHADVRVLDTETGRSFLAMVESKTPLELSQVILAHGNGEEITRIEDPLSVDMKVVERATVADDRDATIAALRAELAEVSLKYETASRERQQYHGELIEYRQRWNQLRSAQKCPKCSMKCATLAADDHWICEDCKHRWPVNSACKSITCIFCNTPCDSLAALKEHSATCGEHPAVKSFKIADDMVKRLRKAHDSLQLELSEIVSDTKDENGVWLMRCTPDLPNRFKQLEQQSATHATQIAERDREIERLKGKLENSEEQRRELVSENLKQFDGQLSVPVFLPHEKYEEFKSLFDTPHDSRRRLKQLEADLAEMTDSRDASRSALATINDALTVVTTEKDNLIAAKDAAIADREAKLEEKDAEIERLKADLAAARGSLKHRLDDEQLKKALENVGVDLNCGRCAGIFYAGSASEDHDEGCKTWPTREHSTPQPALRPDRYRNRQEYVPQVHDRVRLNTTGIPSPDIILRMCGTGDHIVSWVGVRWYTLMLKIEGCDVEMCVSAFDLITPAPTTAVVGEQGETKLDLTEIELVQHVTKAVRNAGDIVTLHLRRDDWIDWIDENDRVFSTDFKGHAWHDPGCNIVRILPTVPDAPEARDEGWPCSASVDPNSPYRCPVCSNPCFKSTCPSCFQRFDNLLQVIEVRANE